MNLRRADASTVDRRFPARARDPSASSSRSTRSVATPSTRASAICSKGDRLLRLNQACLRGSPLGVAARRFSARPQLIVDQRMDRPRQTSRRSRSAWRAVTVRCASDDAQRMRRPPSPARRDASRLRRRARASGRLRCGDRRLSKTEVHQLPGEQRADRAAPHAAARRLGSTGPDSDGMTDCGRTWPKMLLAVARFDCHSESRRGR